MRFERVSPLYGVTLLEWGGRAAAFAGRILAGLGAEVWVATPAPASPLADRQVPPVPSSQCPHRLWSAHLSAGKRNVPLAPSSATSTSVETLVGHVQAVITAPAPHFTAADEAMLHRLAAAGCLPAWVCIDPQRSTRATAGRALSADDPQARALPPLGAPRELCAGIYAACLCLLQLGGGQRPVVTTLRSERFLQRLCHLFSLDAHEGTPYWDRGFALLPTRDGEISLSLLGNWSALAYGAAATGAPDWLTRPELDKVDARYRHAEAIFASLAQWSRQWRAAALTRWAQLRRIPAASVRSPAALPACQQLRRRRFFVSAGEGVALAERHQMRVPPLFLSRRQRQAGSNDPHPAEPWHDQRRAPDRARAARSVSGPDTAQWPAWPPALHVLDLTWAIAGPLATLLLARTGARVTRVDPPGTSAATVLHPELFTALRAGKDCVEIDATNDLARLRELVRQSDVVIDNFSARVLDNWGLTHDALLALRPGLVQVKMTAFGISGPLRHWIGYAPTIHAWSGHTWLLAGRSRQRRPGGWPIPYADVLSGLIAFLAVLAGLWYRRRTGRGLLIDLSQYECAVFALGPHALAAAREAANHAAPPAFPAE